MSRFLRFRFPIHPLVFTFVILATLLSVTSIAFAAVPVVTITSPGGSQYYLQSNALTVSANITNTPTTINFYYNNIWKGNLYPSGGSYSSTWTPSYSDFVKGYNSGGSWWMPDFKVAASNSSGSASQILPGFVTIQPRSFYSSMDNTWYYSSPSSNSFRGVATGTGPAPHGTTNTYNCLAYSVGITDHWEWPWYSNPTYSDCQTYMTNKGYSISSTTNLKWANIIYYNGGHFAKVVAWDSYGYPSQIMSKWGCCEVVFSTNANPFYGGSYGSTTYWFKHP